MLRTHSLFAEKSQCDLDVVGQRTVFTIRIRVVIFRAHDVGKSLVGIGRDGLVKDTEPFGANFTRLLMLRSPIMAFFDFGFRRDPV